MARAADQARGASIELPEESRESKAGKAKRRDPLWAKLLVVFGALLMMLGGTALIGVRMVVAKAEGAVEQTNLLGREVELSSVPDGPVNFLLIGLDTREDQEITNARADTVVIVHIPASRDRAYLVTVPRDLRLDVPKFEKSNYWGGTAKLTETFYHGAQNDAGLAGGVELVAKTLNQRLGITFHGAAVINFQSFLQVVEQLGGVDMCVDQDVKSKHIFVDGNGTPTNIEDKSNKWQYGEPMRYHKGECRRFQAWEALDFARQRYGLENGDYDRQRHQMQLIKAIAKAATSKGVVTDFGKLNGVIEAAGQAFVLDTQGVPITDYVLAMSGISGDDLVTLRTNAGDFAGESIDGKSYQTLTPESELMFQALNEGTLDLFLVSHPDYLASS